MNNELVIIGAGGHSKVIIDIFERMGKYRIVGLTDRTDEEVLGYPVLGTDDILVELYNKGVFNAFIALGNNSIRKKLYTMVDDIGFNIVSAISPDSVISRHSNIGKGVAVMPGAVINPGTTIGDGAIINTNASVDHDCVIESFVHIAPGCAVSGSSKVGSGTFLGTGSRVIDGITIGSNSIIGAGSAVVRDLEDNITAVGVPARKIKDNR